LYFREFLKEESEPQLSTQPSSALLSRLGLKLGENIVRFEILGLREDCACLPCVPQSSGTFMNSDVHGSTTDVSMDNGPIAGGGASGVTSSTTSSSSLSTSSLPQPHAFVDCSVWLYERDAQFLIFDIDGTITRSDVRGYIETIFLGMFGHTHSGVIDFAQQIRQAADSSERTDASADDTNRTSTGRKSGKALNMLYLTSRPISQLPETKGFLAKFHQGDSQCKLGLGPVVCNRDFALRAFYGEVVVRKSEHLKTTLLAEILAAFRAVCGACAPSPFLLGVGNRLADCRAYHYGGEISLDLIFMVDTSSKIVTWQLESVHEEKGGSSNGLSAQSRGAKWFIRDAYPGGYTDQRLLNVILSRLRNANFHQQ
jgi:hypothetical protein